MISKNSKHKKSITRFVDQILLLESRSIISIQGCCSLVSLLPLMVMLFVLPKLPSNPILELILIGLFFFFGGSAGVIAVYRRELPQFIPLKGRPAVALGTLLALTGFGFVVYIIVLIIKNILQIL